MKKCPHCGQSVQAMGSVCPLCRHDMGTSIDEPRDSEPSLPSPDELAAVEQHWAERSDEVLEEAAHELDDYTEVGQRVIREELRRRSIPLPEPES